MYPVALNARVFCNTVTLRLPATSSIPSGSSSNYTKWLVQCEENERQLNSVPTPLPAKRERRLTISSEPTDAKSQGIWKPYQRTHHQAQSLFFRLPFEIRQCVYTMTLSGEARELHITAMNKRLGSIRCFACL